MRKVGRVGTSLFMLYTNIIMPMNTGVLTQFQNLGHRGRSVRLSFDLKPF